MGESTHSGRGSSNSLGGRIPVNKQYESFCTTQDNDVANGMILTIYLFKGAGMDNQSFLFSL